MITKENGTTELVDFGSFVVNQPSIEATIDNTDIGKGQFDVTIKTNTVPDVEKLIVPVWSKEDRSDEKNIKQLNNRIIHTKLMLIMKILILIMAFTMLMQN